MASTDAQSQPKRPAAMARQSSTSSHVSLSPSDAGIAGTAGTAGYKPPPHKAQRQHVVGQSRVQRNTSFGKNLNKLNKAAQAQAQAQVQAQAQAQAHAGDAIHPAKHHRRTHSGNSNSAPSSPGPSFKRNASSGGIVRAAHQTHAHAHAAIRKNLSSGQLARQQQSSSKNLLKSSKSEIAADKRSLAHPGKPRHHSPDAHPTVHFDVGDVEGEGPDDGWTEESASQSPTTTRSNTRSNSVILDPQHKAMDTKPNIGRTNNGDNTQAQVHYFQTPHAAEHTVPDRSLSSRPTNGTTTHHHSRPPDADMITSRLLQRSVSHNPPPQMSSIAATVTSDSHDARVLSQSAGSTLIDTPGRDLVSRFMDGDGSAGTPKDSSFLPSRNSPATGGDFDLAKRNKSMPNVTGADTPTREPSRRSGTTTPTALPPSRTAQKLMLQRASSNIEPQKLIPVVLPRTGGPTYIQSSMTYAAGNEGRLDPRLQQQFNHVAVEYKVVRRYRNPLVDGIVRIQQIPGVAQKTRARKSAGSNGFVSGHGISGRSTSFHETGVETDDAGSRRSRVSFENGRAGRDDGDPEGRQSFESDRDRTRTRTSEAEEICRRLWESTEVVEGD